MSHECHAICRYDAKPARERSHRANGTAFETSSFVTVSTPDGSILGFACLGQGLSARVMTHRGVKVSVVVK